MTKFPIRDSHGAGTGIGGITIDITASKQLQEQLFQSQKMETLGQLTGGIAHDFNNLLTVILGNTEMLADALGKDTPLGSLAETATLGASRAAELTNRLSRFLEETDT